VNSPLVFWATHKLGGAISPANPAYGSSELAYQLKDSGSTALITSSSLLPTALEALKDVPAISAQNVFLVDGDKHDKYVTVEQLIQLGRNSGRKVEQLRLKKGEGMKRLAFICYSSGTTGLPKGVMISHYNIIANVLQISSHTKEFDDRKREITLALLPLYHIYGMASWLLLIVRISIRPPWRTLSWKHMRHCSRFRFSYFSLLYSEISNEKTLFSPPYRHQTRKR